MANGCVCDGYGGTDDFAIPKGIHFKEVFGHENSKGPCVAWVCGDFELIGVFALLDFERNHLIPSGTARAAVDGMRAVGHFA